MASKHEIQRSRANLSDELHGAALYHTPASVERVDARQQIFTELADSSRKHAQVRVGWLSWAT